LRNFYADLQRRLGDVKGAPPTVAPAAGSSMESQGSTLPSASSATALPDQDQQSVPKEQKIYEDAFSDLQQKKYDSASSKFVSYIKSYPKGAYAVNAHYWLGECYYLLNQFDKSSSEFKTVLSKYPNSTKTADSLLKLGIIHNSMGKYAEARKELQQVQSRFPGSTAAQLATHQLASMTADATSEANKKKQKQLIE
jgi:tol-pal system protein YbgF